MQRAGISCGALGGEVRDPPKTDQSADEAALQGQQYHDSDEQDGSSIDSSASGRGWDAVGAGVTNLQDLLGTRKKRMSDTRHGLNRKEPWRRDRTALEPSEMSSDRDNRMTPKATAPTREHDGNSKHARRIDRTVDTSEGHQQGHVHSEESLDESGHGENVRSISDDDGAETLNVEWDATKDDQDQLPHEASKRIFTQELLQRLISEAGLPLVICLQHDEMPDLTVKFFDRPKVFLKGPSEAGQALTKSLPRGFSVVSLNATCSILARASTPPPMTAQSDEDDEEQPYAQAQLQWQDSDGAEGTDLDCKYTAGNLTVQEYRERMEPRLFKLRCRADISDANAAFELGMRLLNASGVRKDPINGCRYLMSAASRGHCFAQTELGTCYELGVGVHQDSDTAVKWWKLASAGNEHVPAGVVSAMHNLAVAYSQGRGVKRDYILACHWHKKAAKLGDRDSQYNLAYYYTAGKGVRRHDRKAAFWLLQAAQQGCPKSALELAARYWRAQGVKRDIAKTSQWLRKAARHLEGPRRILEAIGSGANASAVDELFPSALSTRRGVDEDLMRAHAELQMEISAQLERARTRSVAVQARSAREDLVPGTRLGRRLEQALGEASVAAFQRMRTPARSALPDKEKER